MMKDRVATTLTPKPSWSIERGVGYCVVRSRSYKRRMGHLFTASDTVNGVTTSRCSWCWKAQP